MPPPSPTELTQGIDVDGADMNGGHFEDALSYGKSKVYCIEKIKIINFKNKINNCNNKYNKKIGATRTAYTKWSTMV